MTAIPNGDANGTSSLPETETVTVNGEKTVIIESGGSSDSSSLVIETSKHDVDEDVKEENLDVNDDSPSTVDFPKAVEGLHEMGPTPFLRKTYEIVDEPVTDSIVSWSSTQNSFIIWDSYKFSEILLPKYFKHNNFSSFIRQLNTYGFKKVDSDRWEFANEGFQRGNKNLLKNIKRRSKSNCNKDTSTEIEIESLKKYQSSMRLEMLELKQQQEESHNQMVTVQEKINGVESKQQHMISFFARLAKDQRFVERLMRKRKIDQQRELAAKEFIKKLKFLQDQETQEKLLDVEKLDIAATQPNVEADVMMNYEIGNTRCQLNTNEGPSGGKTGRDSKIYRDLEDLITEEWTD